MFIYSHKKDGLSYFNVNNLDMIAILHLYEKSHISECFSYGGSNLLIALRNIHDYPFVTNESYHLHITYDNVSYKYPAIHIVFKESEYVPSWFRLYTAEIFVPEYRLYKNLYDIYFLMNIKETPSPTGVVNNSFAVIYKLLSRDDNHFYEDLSRVKLPYEVFNLNEKHIEYIKEKTIVYDYNDNHIEEDTDEQVDIHIEEEIDDCVDDRVVESNDTDEYTDDPYENHFIYEYNEYLDP